MTNPEFPTHDPESREEKRVSFELTHRQIADLLLAIFNEIESQKKAWEEYRAMSEAQLADRDIIGSDDIKAYNNIPRTLDRLEETQRGEDNY